MNYSVIIEKRDGVFRAMIPALPNLTAESATRDDALLKARRAAESYLADVEVVNIQVGQEPGGLRPSSPQAWLRTEPLFPDDDLFRQHLAEIAAEKELQRQEAEREADLAEMA
jgi:predicted RNase H-like HicB family nuclease